MTFTYDPTTSTGRVRLLIPDEQVEATAAFTDEEIAALLALDSVGNVVELAAAAGLERIASDQLLLLKKVRVDVIEVDGRAVSDGFLSLAGRLRAAYEQGGDEEDAVQIAELVYGTSTFRERIFTDWQRNG